MSWQRLKSPDITDPDVRKRTRLLIDESLGPEAASYLRGRGYNAVFVGDVGLGGRSDEDVFAYGWREQRMIWTHDKDFLDDERFPEHRNPGIVVLPGGAGDQRSMGIGIGTALVVFGIAPSVWIRTKSVISPAGEMTIRKRNLDSGKVETTRYRMTGRGYAEVWEHD